MFFVSYFVLVLKLNQLNYSSVVFSSVSGMLCGLRMFFWKLMCLLRISVRVRVVVFVLMWIVVLLVQLIMLMLLFLLNSVVLRFMIQFLFYIYVVIGKQLMVVKMLVKISQLLNFVWLVMVLEIRVMVMIVKVVLQVMLSRVMFEFLLVVRFDRLKLVNGFFVKVVGLLIVFIEKLKRIYSIVMRLIELKFIIIMLMMFFVLMSLLQKKVMLGVMSSISVVVVIVYEMLLGVFIGKFYI